GLELVGSLLTSSRAANAASLPPVAAAQAMPSTATTALPVIRAGPGLRMSLTLLSNGYPDRHPALVPAASGRGAQCGGVGGLVDRERAAPPRVEEARRVGPRPAAARGAWAAGFVFLPASDRGAPAAGGVERPAADRGELPTGSVVEPAADEREVAAGAV